MTKKTKAKSPDKLAKTGKKSGVELSEGQLGQAKGGLIGSFKFDQK
jgi:hypothetical protein